MLIKDGKNGFLTCPGDPKGLERAIRVLCNDESLRKSMGSFGRKLLEAEFTSDKMVDRTLKLYDSLC
jgi:glycosyltransferase involved in cell wall biosynthesis